MGFEKEPEILVTTLVVAERGSGGKKLERGRKQGPESR